MALCASVGESRSSFPCVITRSWKIVDVTADSSSHLMLLGWAMYTVLQHFRNASNIPCAVFDWTHIALP